MSRWPGGARAAVAISFDNLGEAAEIELGLRDPDGPLGDHYSVTTALPIVLDVLATARLPATFFVEGINAEIYPDALATIAAAGHELAFHAWCHEDWSALDADAEEENLERGLNALRAIGVEVLGMRPPGGRLTPRTLDLLARHGLRYCSPAGTTAGLDRVAVLPFAWPAVDAFHVLPPFGALREHVSGDAEPGGAEAVRGAMAQALDEALASGGLATLVLHTWMVELELDVVRELLARVRTDVDAGRLWAAPCREVAAWIAERSENFAAPPRLDETSWTAPATPD